MRPQTTCSVNGCEEEAVTEPRAPVTADVVDVPAGEIVPLCADHAEDAHAPQEPPKT
jgi:hypothetical protein